jgi:uncharacterized protein (DUF433 family)
MTVAVAYPHIVKTEGNPAHLERMPRIRVSQIVIDYLNHGWSADEICIHYPHLKQAEVHSAMAYYFDHRAEIDAEIDEEQKLIEEWRKNTPPSPFMLRMKAQGLITGI